MMAKQYGMLIDTTRCMGCQTCVVTCRVNNATPSDIFWGRVKSADGGPANQPIGTYPDCRLQYRPELCNHCASPACVANCPTGAMHKRDEDGVVTSDPEICIGCATCVQSCPYEIPQIDQNAGVSSKCNLCAALLEDGKNPWCVESCPADARFIGDLSDPESELSRLIAEKEAKPLNEEFGTSPSVYYR